MLDEDHILQYLYRSSNIHKHRRKLHGTELSRQVRERLKFRVIANLSLSRYDLGWFCSLFDAFKVRTSIREAGFDIRDKEDLSDAMLIWTDNFLPFDRVMNLKPYQRVNHFPGMIEICRKDFLAKNFMRMNRLEPEEYDFIPKTWVLPQEHGFFLNYVRRTSGRSAKPTFILKPANGAMGHGIRLYRNGENVPANLANGLPYVIQEYIQNPLLIDDYKCDLRVYVLVTSCDPLRVFIYNEGLVRLSTEKYMALSDPNGESMYRHLTNYAVNKRHADYSAGTNDMDGSKRSFTFLDQYLRETRRVDPHVVWRAIRDLIVKTMTLVAPHLLHSYRMCRRGQTRLLRSSHSLDSLNQRHAPGKGSKQHKEPGQSESTRSSSLPFSRSSFFEILGFDILIDSELKPWLIEVNRSPSFNGDLELDRRVKHGLLKDALHLLNIRHTDKAKSEREQRLLSVHRLYHRDTPLSGTRRARGSSLDVNSAKSAPEMRVNSSIPHKKFQLKPDLAKQVENLYLQLLLVRRRSAVEFFEYHNSGNWCLIFPTDDRPSQQRFVTLLLKNFAQFHNGKGGDILKDLEEVYLHPITEEEILGKLDKLLRKHADVASEYRRIFLQDMDGFQVDDYEVSSSNDESDTPSATSDDGYSDTGVSRAIPNVNISNNLSAEEQKPSPVLGRYRLSPLRHLLTKNIGLYPGRQERRPTRCTGNIILPTKCSPSTLPWRI